jgi:FkbM family methyltransferase
MDGVGAAWGEFSPRGLEKALIAASRHSLLGHGEARRIIWRVLRARSSRCFDVVVNHVRMRLFPFDNSVERTLLLRPQKAYPRDLAFLRAALQSAPTLVDVGANIGAMSLPMARMPSVRVIGVEPGPEALNRLRFNIAANEFANFQVDPVALSDANSSIRFFADAKDIKLSGIGAGGPVGNSMEVPTKTLETLLSDHGVDRPYVLKIDVERHEDRVLLPFFAATSREVWPAHILIETLEREGVPECVSFMLGNGYRQVLSTPQNTGLSLVR